MELLKLTWYVIRRRWPIILIVLVVALTGGALYNATQKSEYTASTSLFLRAPDVKTSSSAYQGDLFSRQRAQTYMNIITSDELAQSVVDKLGLSMSPTELEGRVSASTVKDTVIIVLSAKDSDPQQAANIANGYASVFASYVAKVENVQNDPNVPPLVTVINAASADTAVRGGYSLPMTLVFALIAALVVSALIIWFLEYFDTKPRTRREVEEAAGAPVIATFGSDIDDPGVPNGSLTPALAEEAQRGGVAVRQRLQQLTRSDVDTDDDDGNVDGAAFALVGDRVGVGAVQAGYAIAEGIAASGSSVSLLTIGAYVADVPADSGSSVTLLSLTTAFSDESTIRESLEQLRSKTDFVVVACSSAVTSVESEVALSLSDGLVLCVAPARSTSVGIREAVRVSDGMHKPMLGVVVTHAVQTPTVSGVYV
ncbi:Wzz/FepE/Etk N-terminal domain-containing protein [Gordonia sputi]|uniref:Wzz/FepE/Etk N-terminal domain-containing protein n=1 Tax=Gordonia sputi TaxID=36823 RepID=UPI00204382F1|nr:Wzz/FepE/Etk N-terminal domain-containing protein [Gordonia sputi]MCM3896991.1 Wzz/FepE/Etk N-terminal domain-containing protein [Gordonia sputi]